MRYGISRSVSDTVVWRIYYMIWGEVDSSMPPGTQNYRDSIACWGTSEVESLGEAGGLGICKDGKMGG